MKPKWGETNTGCRGEHAVRVEIETAVVVVASGTRPSCPDNEIPRRHVPPILDRGVEAAWWAQWPVTSPHLEEAITKNI